MQGALRQRASHRKSRLGCHECKSRRTKCDEKKPRCGRCQKRGLACGYAEPSTKEALSHVALPPGNVSSIQCPYHPANRLTRLSPVPAPGLITSLMTGHSDVHFETRDMALFHHWCISTSLSIFQDASVDDIWQKTVPQIACHHPHVMYSILCLAALHFASVEPSHIRELLVSATQYHDKAITGFRSALNDINGVNCHGVFATATMNTFYIFATYGTFYNDDTAGLANKRLRFMNIDWIGLVRGIGTVMQPVYEALHAGPLRPLFFTGNGELANSHPGSSPEDSVFHGLRQIWDGKEDAGIYNQTLQKLRQALASEDSQPWRAPFTWLHAISDKYLDRLHQRQPPALIIFAYFGVLVHNLNAFWWAEGCGKEIVSEVAETLGPYWTQFLEWPRQTVGLS